MNTSTSSLPNRVSLVTELLPCNQKVICLNLVSQANVKILL